MAGLRFAVYMVGVIVVIVGLWLLLTAAGIFDFVGRTVVVGIVVIILGLGTMAASAMIWERDYWRGPRRRRYYETRSGGPHREPVREYGPGGETRETIVEED